MQQTDDGCRLIQLLIQSLNPNIATNDNWMESCKTVLSARLAPSTTDLRTTIDRCSRLLDIKSNKTVHDFQLAVRLWQSREANMGEAAQWSVLYTIMRIAEQRKSDQKSSRLPPLLLSRFPAYDSSYSTESSLPFRLSNENPPSNSLRPLSTSTIRSTADAEDMEILRDVLCAIQGLSSVRIEWLENGDCKILDTLHLPQSVRALASRLCTLGKHIRVVDKMLQSEKDFSPHELNAVGNIWRSFMAALRVERSEYLKLFASLEDDRTRGVLSLHVLWARTIFARADLPWLALIASHCGKLRGGALLEYLAELRNHGDERLVTVVSRLLSRSIIPLESILALWLREGLLRDPYNEFFIAENREETAENFWTSRFSIRREMIPFHLVDEDTVRVIERIGKSVAFVRQICGESLYSPIAVLQNAKSRDDLQHSLSDFGTNDLTSLLTGKSQADPLDHRWYDNHRMRRSLLEMLQPLIHEVDTQVLTLLKGKYMILQHVDAIRRFVLMAQSDYASAIVQMLGVELDKDAELLRHRSFTHVLDRALQLSAKPDAKRLRSLGVFVARPKMSSSKIEGNALISAQVRSSATRTGQPYHIADSSEIRKSAMAVNSSKSQYSFEDVQVRSRLEFREVLLPNSDRAIGWDVFAPYYKVDGPLYVLLSFEAMNDFRALYSVVCLVKRTARRLLDSWIRIRRNAYSELMSDEQSALARRRHFVILYQCILFVKKFETYLLVGCVEQSWAQFLKTARKVTNVDELIVAHRFYVAELRSKTLSLSLMPDVLFKTLVEKLCQSMMSYTEGLVRVIESLSSWQDSELNLLYDDMSLTLDWARGLLETEALVQSGPDIARVFGSYRIAQSH